MTSLNNRNQNGAVSWKWLAATAIGVLITAGSFFAFSATRHMQLPMHEGARDRVNAIEKALFQMRDEIRADFKEQSVRLRGIEQSQATIKADLKSVKEKLDP